MKCPNKIKAAVSHISLVVVGFKGGVQVDIFIQPVK